jgi:hypothetical protein
MVRRIGRNDPCHCGSGLKLKRCHKVSRRIPPVRPKVEEPEIDRLFREKYNEVVQDARHFSSDLVPFIVKKRMKNWLKNLMKGKNHESN